MTEQLFGSHKCKCNLSAASSASATLLAASSPATVYACTSSFTITSLKPSVPSYSISVASSGTSTADVPSVAPHCDSQPRQHWCFHRTQTATPGTHQLADAPWLSVPAERMCSSPIWAKRYQPARRPDDMNPTKIQHASSSAGPQPSALSHSTNTTRTSCGISPRARHPSAAPRKSPASTLSVWRLLSPPSSPAISCSSSSSCSSSASTFSSSRASLPTHHIAGRAPPPTPAESLQPPAFSRYSQESLRRSYAATCRQLLADLTSLVDRLRATNPATADLIDFIVMCRMTNARSDEQSRSSSSNNDPMNKNDVKYDPIVLPVAVPLYLHANVWLDDDRTSLDDNNNNNNNNSDKTGGGAVSRRTPHVSKAASCRAYRDRLTNLFSLLSRELNDRLAQPALIKRAMEVARLQEEDIESLTQQVNNASTLVTRLEHSKPNTSQPSAQSPAQCPPAAAASTEQTASAPAPPPASSSSSAPDTKDASSAHKLASCSNATPSSQHNGPLPTHSGPPKLSDSALCLLCCPFNLTIYSSHGVVMQANKSCLQTMGYKRSEAIGNSVVMWTTKESVLVTAQLVASLMLETGGKGAVYCDADVIRKDGRIVRIKECTIMIMRIGSNVPVGCLCLSQLA